MALVDVALRRGYIGGSFGLLRVTLGRVSIEGWRTPDEVPGIDGGQDMSFVWFEGVRREAPIDEAGHRLDFARDAMVEYGDEIAGFPVMA